MSGFWSDAVKVAAITAAATLGAAGVSAVREPERDGDRCSLARDHVDDESPNPDLTPRQRAELAALSVEVLKECWRRDDGHD